MSLRADNSVPSATVSVRPVIGSRRTAAVSRITALEASRLLRLAERRQKIN